MTESLPRWASEIVGRLPGGWTATTIGELGDLISGSTPPRAQPEKYFNGGRIAWVKTGDLTNGDIVSTDECVTDAAVSKCRCTVHPPGTVLIAMYGGFEQIGRTGILRIPAATNQAITAVRLHPGASVSPEFLQYWLNHKKPFWRRIAGSSRKDPNIAKADIATFPVPVPCDRAIAKMDRAMASFARTSDLLAQAIAARRTFKRGLMQQLLTGQKRFPEFVRSTERQAGQFGTIPKDWNLLHIGQVAVESKARGAVDGSVVYSCTKHDGLVPSMEYFGKQVFSRNLEGYRRLKTGDIAYATNHIEEGSIGLLREGMAPGLVSPMYTVFTPSESAAPEFLFALLKTESYRRVFANRMSASVDRRGSLRWDDFSRIKVGVPTVSEQRRIVDTLRIADAEIDQLERLRELIETQKRGLLSRLLSGEIQVPEPASDSPPESAPSRSNTTVEVA